MNKLEKIEALRGAAALYVVLHHAFPHHYYVSGFNVYNFFRLGQEAVILFFLLSGFVIKYSFYHSKNKSFKRYFFRRFLRLYIPLVLVLLIGYLILSLKNGRFSEIDVKNLLGNLLMLQDWAKVKPHVFFDPFLGNNPLWSLAYEWWFYMLFYPIATALKNDESRNIFVFSSCFLAALLYTKFPFFPIRIVMYLAIWWLGAVLAEQYIKDPKFGLERLMIPIGFMVAIIFVLGFDVVSTKSSGGLITLGFHPLLEFRHFLFAIIAVFLAFAWRHFNWFLFRALIMPFAVVAPISYTIYILHWPVMIDADFLVAVSDPIVRWFGYLLVLIVLSYLIELVIYPKVSDRIRRLIE